VRLNASKAILNALAPLTELNELRSRLDELEKQRVST
jgi:tetrahydromethanopterin S-methyltransferase subunit G